MKTPEGFRSRELAAILTLAVAGALLAPGCGGDDNPEPTTPVITGGTGGSTGGSAGKGSGSAAEGGEDGNDPTAGEGGEDSGSGGRGGRGGSGGRGGRDGSGGSGNAGSGNTGNTGEGGEGGGGEDIDCSIRGENNCYRCAPQAITPAPEFPRSENEQFLNHCDDSQGSPFDNFERIPGFTGELPALP